MHPQLKDVKDFREEGNEEEKGRQQNSQSSDEQGKEAREDRGGARHTEKTRREKERCLRAGIRTSCQ
jgi:hypothetical protein